MDRLAIDFGLYSQTPFRMVTATLKSVDAGTTASNTQAEGAGEPLSSPMPGTETQRKSRTGCDGDAALWPLIRRGPATPG